MCLTRGHGNFRLASPETRQSNQIPATDRSATRPMHEPASREGLRGEV